MKENVALGDSVITIMLDCLDYPRLVLKELKFTVTTGNFWTSIQLQTSVMAHPDGFVIAAAAVAVSHIPLSRDFKDNVQSRTSACHLNENY